MQEKNIRNFSIIAHIDHGKSTLADRMLDVTHTIEKRKMMDQVLDNMELERERGITIKMQPVRMVYSRGGNEYILNLIDTPGHIDFSYEVSRAIKAVEGSVLLVDATQGVQAQTLSVLEMAQKSGLVIVPAVSKVDSPLARVEEVKLELATLLKCDTSTVLEVSGKTGQGVETLLQEVIERVPPPRIDSLTRALVFDFKYDSHRGVIVYVRMLGGSFKKNDKLVFKGAQETFIALEVGIFAPTEKATSDIQKGEIGYIVTGIKQPGIASVGDTITTEKNPADALSGYERPRPVVWASLFPEEQDDFELLKQSLNRLRLSDSSLTFEEESSGTLGRGFRIGLLGMLHLEIVTERLKREFGLALVVTTPSITYKIVNKKDVEEWIYSPHKFPDDGSIKEVYEPWSDVTIITPNEYVGSIMQLLYDHEAIVGESDTFGDDRNRILLSMPLRELMRNFFDRLKSVTSGYASISYEQGELKFADVVRLDVLVADESVPAFASVVSRRKAQEEAEKAVTKLASILPRGQVAIKVQGKAMGRILSSETVKPFRKDVTGSLYGGDITRKMKLLQKQKKGKKKMEAAHKVHIPEDVFVKMMRRGDN
ncbi:MAG: translation elongation factor 4 [Candidatus Pacebacteria bacterium]|nr:translation elongation factor 4 [Candidatus Paceibacterota bacterium]